MKQKNIDNYKLDVLQSTNKRNDELLPHKRN